MMLKQEFICAIFVLVLATLANAKLSRTKRMYAMCPPHFQRIGSECYFISTDRVNWLDAHFECKDRNGRLAEPYKYEDRLLRKYMQRADRSRSDFWIGGIFNWQQNKWQWGYNGRDMTYQSFSQMATGNTQDLKFHCAILNPNLKYRWSSRSCVDKHNYICQHRMPYVNEKNRQKVYNKWNETYPNEMANEIVEVIDEDNRLRNNNRRGNRRPFNKNRQRNFNERNRQANSIQTPLDDRLENRIDVPRPINPINQNRPRPNRQRPNGRGHKHDLHNNTFELHHNRSRFYNPRNRIRIDFGENDKELLKRRQEHQMRRRNRLRTTTTTTTTARPATTTTTESIRTTMRPPAEIGSTTEDAEEKYRAELAEERARIEQEELSRYEEKVRFKQEEEQLRMKQEERRIYLENERRTQHLKDQEKRRLELEKEQQQADEIERLRREKQRQNEERNHQNEINRAHNEDLLRQRELIAQRNPPATLAPVLSNDVLDHQPTTANAEPKPPKKTEEEKKRRRDALRRKLANLSPAQQQEYLQRKLERNRKRGIVDGANNDVAQ